MFSLCFTYDYFQGRVYVYERSDGSGDRSSAKAKIAKLKTEKAKKEQEVQG